jgi:predicted  nucleic acid-binding Zn-ribbon protein
MPENMEHEELKHFYTQLSREMDAIKEYIVLYQNQMAMLKELQEEKEEAINQLTHDKEEIMRGLQDMELQLEDQCNEW